MANDSTPATKAGITFMTTELGYATSPPGTYSPTRCTGTHFSMTSAPALTLITASVRRCASCTNRARRAASSTASRTCGSIAASAASSAACGTRVVVSSTPSKRAVASMTAAKPRSRMSSKSGVTIETALLISKAALGRTWAYWLRELAP